MGLVRDVAQSRRQGLGQAGSKYGWLYGLLGMLGFGVVVGGFMLGTQAPRWERPRQR